MLYNEMREHDGCQILWNTQTGQKQIEIYKWIAVIKKYLSKAIVHTIEDPYNYRVNSRRNDQEPFMHPFAKYLEDKENYIIQFHFLSGCLVSCSFQGGVSVPGPMFLLGVSVWGSLSGGSLSRGFLSMGLCPGCLCPGGLCPPLWWTSGRYTSNWNTVLFFL